MPVPSKNKRVKASVKILVLPSWRVKMAARDLSVTADNLRLEKGVFEPQYEARKEPA